jgi:1-acyl-sn-glycerol-3-phosphate acyltransferase
MSRFLSILFQLVARVVVSIVIGLRIEHKERLPTSGPAILVANHNSHLDTIVLMSLFPLSMVHRLRPVANEQYFLQRNPLLAWFSEHILQIIPVSCESKTGDASADSCAHRTFFKKCASAIAQNQILILYPEGTRGEPECLSEFKSGVAHLAKQHPEVPIIPVFLHGLGKALPKGEILPVPFLCWVFIGESIYWNGNKQSFLNQLTERMCTLSAERKCLV